LERATPSVDDSSLITDVQIKTGANCWFSRENQGSNNPEQNQFKNQSSSGGRASCGSSPGGCGHLFPLRRHVTILYHEVAAADSLSSAVNHCLAPETQREEIKLCH